MINTVKSVFKILAKIDRWNPKKFVIISIFASLSSFFDIIGLSILVTSMAALLPDQLGLDQGQGNLVYKNIVHAANYYELETLILGVVLVFLIKAGYQTVYYLIQSKFCFSIQASMLEKLCDIYLKKRPSDFYGGDTSEYIRNSFQETEQFNFSVLIAMFSLISELSLITVMLLFLAVIDMQVTLITLLLAFFLTILFTWLLRRPLERNGADRQYYFGLRLKIFRQALDGYKDLTISNSQELFLQEMSIFNRRGVKANYLGHWLSQLPRMWVEFFAVASILIALAYAMLLANDSKNLFITLTLFAGASVRLMPTSSRIMTAINYLHYSKPVVELMLDELTVKNEKIPNLLSLNETDETDVSVVINHGIFKYYEDSDWCLKINNFRINANENVIIFGESGSGKSTILDIISGFKNLTEGKVERNLGSKLELSEAWDWLGYCGQSVYLFDNDLDFNITLSTDPIDIARMSTVLQVAGISSTADSIMSRDDSSLGESGQRLSGGQRQRIGIARALYRKNVKLYIFDEITSNLEQELGHEIVSKILDYAKDEIVIFVSHDRTLEQYFDRTFTVANGEIIEAT